MEVFAGKSCEVFVNVIVSGNHVDVDSNLISGQLLSNPSSVPIVTRIGIGKYSLQFYDLSPELIGGTTTECVISGVINGIPWTPYGISIIVLPYTNNTPIIDTPSSNDLVCECLVANAMPRISAQIGNVVDLNVNFYNNSVLADPFFIQRVEIYRCTVSPANLVAVIPFSELGDSYPSPACRELEPIVNGDCGTEPLSRSSIPGKYHLPFLIPSTFKSPDVYIDVWYFHPKNPCLGDQYPTNCITPTDPGTNCDYLDSSFESQLVTCCHRFWVFPNSWMCDDNLQTINFSFESMNTRFNSPEIKPLEVGLMPLPVYSYNKGLVDPMIPYLKPTITIGTQHCEIIVQDAEMEIGFRQGGYRTNSYVAKWNLNTANFLKGSYWYQIKLTLPNGTTRVSQKFWMEIR